MRGGALATIGFEHDGGEVIAARLAQGILGHLLCCTYLRSGSRCGGSRLHVCIRTAVCHGHIGEQKAVLEDTEDGYPVASRGDWVGSSDFRAVGLK